MRRSGFIDVTREEIAARLDALAVPVEARGKLFESIEARTDIGAWKRRRPCSSWRPAAFSPRARLSDRARELILAYLSRPGFLTGYMAAQTKEAQAKDEPAPDSEKMMAELMEQLGKAGITAETGLKSIALNYVMAVRHSGASEISCADSMYGRARGRP